MSGTALAAAAMALIGAPFRLHGRDPATGLDCIGVVGAALQAIGRPIALPTGYPLRLRSLAGWLPAIVPAWFHDVADQTLTPGDVVLLCPGPGQFHLAIAAGPGGFVHAHAGLRRVVHSPALTDPILHHWRLLPTMEG